MKELTPIIKVHNCLFCQREAHWKASFGDKGRNRMGEIADMMTNGILCEHCGAYIVPGEIWYDCNGSPNTEEQIGIPRYCAIDCVPEKQEKSR